MNDKPQPDVDAVWRRLASAAQSAPSMEDGPTAKPEQVIGAWKSRSAAAMQVVRRETGGRFDDRTAGAFAAAALAASLLLVAADWSFVHDLFAATPAVMEACIPLEPLP